MRIQRNIALRPLKNYYAVGPNWIGRARVIIDERLALDATRFGEYGRTIVSYCIKQLRFLARLCCDDGD